MTGKNNTPAVLFYSQDFLAGVADMTLEERGAYITLLAYQNVHGHMSTEYIERVCPGCPDYVLEKFMVDEDGELFNARMEQEIAKRNKFKDSRYKNLKQNTDIGSDMGHRYRAPISDSDMETETETEIETVNKEIGESEREEEKQIIEYLNMRTGKNYKATTKATREKIRARMREGFTADDFRHVIDIKAAEWMNTEQEKYLRPETLFGTKFEGYLNQRPERRKMSNIEIARAMDAMEKGGTDEQRRDGNAAGVCHGGLSLLLPGSR